MPLQHYFAHILNLLFGGPVTHLLTAIGLPPAHPGRPIDGTFAMEMVAFLILFLFFVIVRITLSVERPGVAQQLAEMTHEFVVGQSEPIIGHGYEKFLPYLTVILLFVGVNNLLGLLPDVDTPTSNPVVPLGLALLTFVYYHWQGLKEQGPLKYAKHFLGPLWWIAWLMLPIEIISHIARVLSLTIRLYANMFASDLLTLIFFSLFPLALPVIFLGLHLGVSLIQAYVFMLLSAIYIGQAISHEEEV
ncbi:MAG TPA: F0F1 ATP synthase subunit A [Acidobacteriaceae bacterium]|jgi:F-type H+-transporting ATPase subunit a|nr:F0F1 ATP synthase subunit A [Acidobacteriaceae bacterium]